MPRLEKHADFPIFSALTSQLHEVNEHAELYGTL
jgi:hypothetical protein